MPFDWNPKSPSDRSPVFANVQPHEVLYELDGEPLLFVSTTGRSLPILCYKTDATEDRSQYIISPTNASVIKKLRNGNISLLSAISQPWLWIADAHDDDFRVLTTWTLDNNSVPEALLPKSGRSLSNARSVIIERTSVREREAYLSVKFRGGEIQNGTIPFGVIKHSLDEVYKSIWGIFVPGITMAAKNLKAKSLRRMINIPTYEMAHSSLLIEIERPQIELPTDWGDRLSEINVDAALCNIDKAQRDFLDATQVIKYAIERGRVTQELAESNFDAIEAVEPIIPRRHSFFDGVEINGRHPDKRMSPLVIDAKQGDMIREVYHHAKLAPRTIEGEVFLVNSHTYRFTIMMGLRQVTCVATTSEQKRRIATLHNGEWAVVRGHFQERDRRDLLHIQTLTIDGLTVA